MATLTPEQELRAAAAELVKATDETKKVADTTNTELKNLGKVTNETKEAADKALLTMNTLQQRLDDLEKKSVRAGAGNDAEEFKSPGTRFIDAEEVKAAMAQGQTWRGHVRIDMKAITSASASGASGTTALVPADRQSGLIQTVPNRQLVVRDLLMPGRTSSSVIEYIKEVLFTNNAAVVAENPGTAKPTSDITFSQATAPVRTIAHLVKASKQILDDAPMLQSYIDGRMRYGLDFVEEQQLLLGDGTGQNLLGLMPQATTYVTPVGVTVTAATKIDTLRLAQLQAVLALFPATGHVLNPVDWCGIELTKDSQGRYIFANPQGVASPTMWGLPVVQSLSMAVASFLTGAFKYAAQVFDREDANVAISTEDNDNFSKNMVTVRAEERIGLAVYRPQALVKGTFV